MILNTCQDFFNPIYVNVHVQCTLYIYMCLYTKMAFACPRQKSVLAKDSLAIQVVNLNAFPLSMSYKACLI